MNYDDEFSPQVSGHETEDGFAFTVKVAPPSREDIADALANAMLRNYTESTALKNTVADRVAQLVREYVDNAAREVIADAMLAPRQRTDEFGNPVGEAISFQKMLADQVQSWQEETVDSYDGKPKKPDSYSPQRVITRAQYLVRQVGAAEFEKLAKAEVAKVQSEARALVSKTIKDTVAASLQALVK